MRMNRTDTLAPGSASTAASPLTVAATSATSPPSTSTITLIHDYYTGVVPPTPTAIDHNIDACPAATRALLQFADDIGRAVGYDREQDGRLIQDIFPVATSERAQVSTSSKVMLGSHTETAFHPHKPRYVVLLCLRGDPQAETTYADVNDVVQHLSPDHLEVLQTSEFVTTVDPSFMTHGEPDARVIVTPLTRRRNDWVLVYDELLMSATTARASVALTALHAAVKQSTKHMVLRTGDLLVIDNYRAVHGRTPFVPRYDGTDRWLKRSLVISKDSTIATLDRVVQTML